MLESPGLESVCMALSISDNERERWNQKYREAPGAGTSMAPDPFLVRAFSAYILPLFPALALLMASSDAQQLRRDLRSTTSGLMITGALLLVYGLVQAPQHGWTSANTAVALPAAFMLRRRKK